MRGGVALFAANNYMDEITTQTGDYPWGKIIFAFFAFWPTGLFLLHDKSIHDRSSILRTEKLLKWGQILLGLGLIIPAAILIFSVSNVSIALGVFLFWGAAGIALLGYAFWARHVSERYKEMIKICINEGISSISEIAKNYGASVNATRRLLRKMIKKDFFPEATIDKNEDKLILGLEQPIVTEGTVVIRCCVCKVLDVCTGEEKKCLYCNSTLKIVKGLFC